VEPEEKQVDVFKGTAEERLSRDIHAVHEEPAGAGVAFSDNKILEYNVIETLFGSRRFYGRNQLQLTAA
jgi:hypothetical protein